MLEVSMSLDGYVTGPNVSAGNPMGDGGARLHRWLFDSPLDSADAGVTERITAPVGAVVLGHRTFELDLPQWDNQTPYGVPGFVVTHHARDPLEAGSASFTFVTDGVQSAVHQAVETAGDKKVAVMGADVAGQIVSAGLLDELHIHLVPLLLGGGRRLFDRLGIDPVEWKQTGLAASDAVTHLHYERQR